MARVFINYKNGKKEILTCIDDIEVDKDQIEIYFYYPDTEPIPPRVIHKYDVKSVFHEYQLFGVKQCERIF